MHLEAIQSALLEARSTEPEKPLDGWLFYDHHHRDPIAYRVLGLDEHSFVSRRWFYFIPAHGEPQKLVHRIEAGKLDTLPGAKQEYASWQELEQKLESILSGSETIAMQYSPRNAIMYVSMVDAGTVELVRSFGKNIVSSADLVSQFEAVLTEAQIATHFVAQQRLDEVLAAGWQYISSACASGRGTDEHSVVQHLLQGIERAGLFTDHGPNCSAGPNSADSHYEPAPETSRPIRTGDFVLIDIWAKLASPHNPTQPDPAAIWYDITWTGVVGRAPTDREQHIFATIQNAYSTNAPIAGWKADDAARNVIRAAGFAEHFTHRTGHNIATVLHGNGANLDNLETHDERIILPNTCFSVEPGLYFPGPAGDPNAFGIRNEVNMITRPGSAIVTGPMQNELLRL
jgi:Xaa-Pro dipeptidase